jgi:hypothetical protein
MKKLEITEKTLRQAHDKLSSLGDNLICREGRKGVHEMLDILVGKKLKDEQFFAVKNRFKHIETGAEYMLCYVNNNHQEISMINLTNGNVWERSYEVENDIAITEYELNKITGRKNWKDHFKLIKKGVI